MAQTKKEIYDEIIAAIAAQPTLASALTSTSNVAIWNQLATAYASVHQTSQLLGDLQEVTLNKIADEAVPGTPAWLQRTVKKFQYGDQVEVNADLTISYPTIDPTKQLITQCSIQENLVDREVLVKVATGDTAATLHPITAQQLISLKAYIQKVKFAGIRINTISLEADRLYAALSVYYAGELDPEVVKADVIAAIDAFLQALPFDGKMYLSKLQDAIQAVPGVNDITLDTIIGRPYSTELTNPGVQPVERVYASQAGYLIPEDTTGFTLADSLNMIAS
jgi:hypothetical protein